MSSPWISVAGGGGTNFDSKLRRQSIDADDLLIGHIGGMDSCARGLKAAAAMIEEGSLQGYVDERYSGWNSDYWQGVLAGKGSLEEVAAKVVDEGIEPEPRSGKQEYLENLVNRFV